MRHLNESEAWELIAVWAVSGGYEFGHSKNRWPAFEGICSVINALLDDKIISNSTHVRMKRDIWWELRSSGSRWLDRPGKWDRRAMYCQLMSEVTCS